VSRGSGPGVVWWGSKRKRWVRVSNKTAKVVKGGRGEEDYMEELIE
jgi:hypothetical protein